MAHLSETGKEAIFRTISHRLRDQDLVALISHNTLDTSFDVGLLEVLYDGPVGREQRATIVRRPRLERQLVTFGYSLYSNSNDQGLVAAAIRTRGIWQQATTRWLREHLQAGAVVVDIGAHVGYFATLAARLVGESGKVVAIEPDPVNADALAMNRDQLPYPETLTVVQMAAGDLAMTAQIVRSRTDHGEHQIHLSRWAQDEQAPAQWRSIEIAAPMRRLDDILRGEGIAHVDVVKVSANGGELAALRGMEVILRRDRPALLVDLTAVADNATGFESSDLYAFLAKLGYQIESLPAEPPAEPNEATGGIRRGSTRRQAIYAAYCKRGQAPSQQS